jgi:hypothetical protein
MLLSKTKFSYLVRTNHQSTATEKDINFFMMQNKKSSSTTQNLDSNHHGTGAYSIASSGSGTIVTDRSASDKQQFIGTGTGSGSGTGISEEEITTSRRENNRNQTLQRIPSFYSDFRTLASSKVVLALEDYDDDLANIASSDNSCSRHHHQHHHDSSSSCNSNCYSILSVDRDQLQKISLLGKGQFCNVYLVSGSLLEPSTPTPTPTPTSSPQQQDQDQVLQQESQDQQKRRPPSPLPLPLPPIAKRKMYAYKSIDPTRVSDANELIVAASDLASEAKILSQLDHPNIIKLRGLCNKPFSTSFAYEVENVNGSFKLDINNNSKNKKIRKNNHNSDGLEGYFLVLDVLMESLSQRLIRMRKNEDRAIATAKSGANSNNRSRRIVSLCNTNAAVVDSDIQAEINCGIRRRMYRRIESCVLGIAKGMEYLSNQKNIVLRDLKPDNVGFDDDGNVRLFDFGMARNIDECTDPGEICGSPRYLAPEVISGKGYTLKVDVYSFGILLFQVCSLQMPYAEYFRSKKNTNNNKNKNKSSSWWKNIVGGGSNNKNTSNNNICTRTNCDGTTPKDQNAVMVEEFYRLVVDMELRPASSDNDSNFDSIVPCPKLRQLIEECWHTDPTKRPSFEDIVPRLQVLFDQNLRCNQNINSSTKSFYSIM